MTGAVSVPAVPGTGTARATGVEPAARVALGAVLVVCTAVSLSWLVLGAAAAAAQYVPAVARSVGAAAAAGSAWARAVVAAAPASQPLGQAVLDYGFSVLNLVLAAVLLGAGRRRGGVRTWSIRLLAVALVGSAGAFNLQAHAAARAIEEVTGLAVGGVHQVVLHAVACAAYILALLVFPTPSWDGLPGARPARGGLVAVGAVTFLLVGLGTALLPHTTSCVLFFGFLVPAVGLVVLPRRLRRGPGAEARTQARLLFSTLVGGFAVAVVLGIVTVILDVLGDTSALTLVDPTAHGATSTAPVALLFWFSRLASAAIAVVVLVATRHDRLWTAERRFSRGLAVLLVTAVAGGGFVVVQAVTAEVLGVVGSALVATVPVALGLGSLYVRAERVVDRLLYGTRPAPYRVLADITALTRSTLPGTGPAGSASAAPDLARVAEAVARGLGAGVCRLTVHRPGLRDRTYSWTDRGAGSDDLVEVPVRHGAEQVGLLAVDRQAVSGLHAQRSQLLTDIADGLGVVLEASRSGIELERQLRAALAHAEEIAVSRRRTVAEMDAERRRIERDLHDGAQHHLVSLQLTLGLVEHQVATGDLDGAREWLARLTGQLAEAEAVLAATADGVSSLVLAEKGLVAALRAELGAAHPPVGFDDGGLARRFPADVEAAVWFCCAEAVGNARKHAPGAPITVRLAERPGVLRFTVRDEGPGFTPDPGASGGRGLRNMTTRLSAVGGRVVLRSEPGAGTTVEGVVPLPAEQPPAPPAPPAVVSMPAPPAVVSMPAPPAPAVASAAEAPAVLSGAAPAAVVPEPAPTASALVAAPAVPSASGRAAGEVSSTGAPAEAPLAAGAVAGVVSSVDAGAGAVPAGSTGPAVADAPAGAVAPTDGSDEPTSLAGQVRELVRAARVAYPDGSPADRLDQLARRLAEPVRIAVLATVDEGRRMLVEALVGTPAVPRPGDGTTPVRYAFGDERVATGADATLVTLPAPALTAMTLLDVPDPARPALLGAPGEAPVADAVVLLLHYGRPEDLVLLDLLHAAGHRGAIAVLAVADEAGAAAERAVREFADDPAVRRVCHAVVPVAPATAAAAARLGDDEHRWLTRWAAAHPEPGGALDGLDARPDLPSWVVEALAAGEQDAHRPGPGQPWAGPGAEPEIAAALLDRLGPLGARRALRLVRSGDGGTRAELAGALVRHSGLGELQELIASRFTGRADALRARSVLAGLDALMQATPPPGGDQRLYYQLERVRAGAHELRELELLGVLRSGELPLPDEQRGRAERLLGADGDDPRTRLGLAAEATSEQLRSVAAAETVRWQQVAAHPVSSGRLRDAAQVLVWTCERLAVDAAAGAGEPGPR